jgi:hypothetical protein
MPLLADDNVRRIASLRARIRTLGQLKRTLALPSGRLSPRQWGVLDTQLAAAVARLDGRLGGAAQAALPRLDDRGARRRLNALLGEIELDLTRAFSFFDTYMDVLSQRLVPGLGKILAGCDRIAWNALRRPHPALLVVEPPLVYCDRGFGASVVREGVPFPDGTPNPMPLIQIPYSRLAEKYNLTSIVHEVGHEVMVRLGLHASLPAALADGLRRAGASAHLSDFFALWSRELGPDFWTFGCSGLAQTAAVREILSLPPADVLRLSPTDPHPPPYLRVLASIAWCRSVWGMGPWDDWEAAWRDVYRLEAAPPALRELLETATRLLPRVGHLLMTTRFKTLGRRPLADLFDLSALAPARIRRIAACVASNQPDEAVPVTAQLAVFRVLRDEHRLDEAAIDRLMTGWLERLAEEPL